MNWSKLQNDFKKIAIPIIAISLYILLANIILGKICPMRMLFGIPCPGCGTTRAFLLLMQGKVTEATISNPIWIPIVVLGLVFFINRYFVASEKASAKIIKMLKRALVVIGVLCIAYYICRMIYWYPNKEPMVYDINNLLQRLEIIKN